MMQSHEDRGHGVFGRLADWMRRRTISTTSMGESATAECPRVDDTKNTDMSDDRMWDLIARHWAEQLGPGEEAALKAWAGESQDRAEKLRSAVRILDLSRELGEADETELAWERVRGRLGTGPIEAHRGRFFQLVLGRVAEASLQRGRVTPRKRASTWVGLAAMLVLAAGIALALRRPRMAVSTPPREWATHAGERVTVELQDGSRVMLGPDTRLRVVSADFRRERTLRLQGVAHFAVAHDSSHPFTVLAGSSSAQAVGTAFAVRAYPDDSTVHVVVSEGRVLFRPTLLRTSPSTMLGPGDAGRVSAAGEASIERGVDLDESLGWMRGRLRYRMTTAADVARDLDRWYGITIVLGDSALATIRITTSFDPAWTAADAVQRLADVLHATAELRDGGVYLARRPRAAIGAPSARPSQRSADARP